MKFRWIASLCLALSAPIAQAGSSPPFELRASVAYSKAFDQYLLVYSSNEIDSGPNVYGRVLSSESALPSGKDFRLSTLDGSMSKPVIAYNARTEQFLVVWSRKLYAEDRAEITGLNVGRNGQVIGQEFRMSFSDLFDERPAIAYCPGRNRFLVTWTRTIKYDFEDGNADVYGQLIGGDGTTLLGGNVAIAAAANNQFKSELTCNEAVDHFMVVWEDQRNLATQDDIYAQRISSDGTMLGGNFLVSGTPTIERRPTIAANKDGTYLVVWESVVNGSPVLFSRTMDSNGNLLGDAIPVGAAVGGQRNRPSVAYLKQQDVFLVAWDNSAFNDVSDGIWGQFFEGSGKPRQTPFPLTTAIMDQYRPSVAAARNSFLAVWTDYRDTAEATQKHHVYEYNGRVIGNDMELSSRWRNPESE